MTLFVTNIKCYCDDSSVQPEKVFRLDYESMYLQKVGAFEQRSGSGYLDYFLTVQPYELLGLLRKYSEAVENVVVSGDYLQLSRVVQPSVWDSGKARSFADALDTLIGQVSADFSRNSCQRVVIHIEELEPLAFSDSEEILD